MFQKLFLIFSFLINYLAYAQPVLLKPISNSILEKAYPDYSTKIKQNDTLGIPFFDDFSKKGIYPDNSLWQDNDVYINQSFGKNPISIGVATFDILNMAGQIYSNASETPFIADYLTSKPINLQYFITYNSFSYPTTVLFYYETASGIYYPADSLYYFNGTHIYNCLYQPGTFTPTMHIYYGVQKLDVSDSLYYFDSQSSQYIYIQRYYTTYYNPSDSIYLSFFYQAQGNGGNAPEGADSLVLEFKTPQTAWTHIWSVPGGNADTLFHKVTIPIHSSTYLKNGFQFRFYNYASFGNLNFPSFASNVDFWNIDYVYIKANSHINDSIYPDVCFKEPVRSLVEPPYTSIPWEHYKQLDTLQIDTLKFSYYNLYSSLLNVKRFVTINNITSQQFIRFDSLGNENINPFEKFSYNQKAKPNLFPDNNLSKSTFEVLLNITAPTLNSETIFSWNDTMRIYQTFDNYYAIDDGTAEYGIGLSGVGSQNGKFAMMFKTLTPDTLRGVDIFFNRTLNNASQKYFYLTIWTCKKGKPDSVIYKKTGFRPEYAGINEFHHYNLDTAIYVSDTIFVGWTQTSTELLNVGFDLNYDYSANVYYNLTGMWIKNPYKGTPMMRPVFSKNPLIHVTENQLTQNFLPYPNPVNEILTISPNEDIPYSLMDITGKTIKSGFSKNLETNHLDNGIYFLQIHQKKSNSIFKIIVQHP